MFTRKFVWLVVAALVYSAAGYAWATTIPLDAVIGVAGTNAGSVAGAGNAVNAVGVILDGGATTLNTGATASYDFNTMPGGDRSTGFGASAPANGWGINKFAADREYAGSVSLKFDRNNNGALDGTETAAATGFGGHADTYLTFDLAAIRTANGLAANTAFTLTGGAGWYGLIYGSVGGGYDAAGLAAYGSKTSGAILLDGSLLQTFDFDKSVGTGSYHAYDTYSLAIPGTAQYLTFADLTGTDLNSGTAGRAGYEHVGYDAPTLTTIPEPASMVLLTIGLFGLLAYAWRRRKKVDL